EASISGIANEYGFAGPSRRLRDGIENQRRRAACYLDDHHISPLYFSRTLKHGRVERSTGLDGPHGGSSDRELHGIKWLGAQRKSRSIADYQLRGLDRLSYLKRRVRFYPRLFFRDSNLYPYRRALIFGIQQSPTPHSGGR